MSAVEIWTYRETITPTIDLTGYEVEAIDGSIGKVDEATNEVGGSYIVVDTGPWIFGKKVLLPAGVIDRVDTEEEKVYVNRTKDEIKNAPEFDESRYQESDYRNEVGTYYGPGGAATATPRNPRTSRSGGPAPPLRPFLHPAVTHTPDWAMMSSTTSLFASA